jgi:hypothetical protein
VLVLRQFNPGKDVVVITTAVCWYIGIVTFNSDYAFTVTNVIIHGVPYMVLVYWYRCKEQAVPQITHYVLDGFIWKRKSTRRLF